MNTRVAALAGDAGLLLLLVVACPVAIILLGAPIVLFVRLLIEIAGRM